MAGAGSRLRPALQDMSRHKKRLSRHGNKDYGGTRRAQVFVSVVSRCYEQQMRPEPSKSMVLSDMIERQNKLRQE